jgi:putative hydrolase of the HAD superfamily
LAQFSEDMPIKAVLFDMFDTLMLIEKNHAFYSPSLKRLHNFLVANGVNVQFKVFKEAYVKARDALYVKADKKLEEPHFNLRISNALKNLGYLEVESSVIAGATEAFCEEFINYVCIDDDAASILEKLYGKYKLGIVSNFAIPECVYKLLEKYGLDKFFEAIVVSGEINKRKPSPEIFRKTLKKISVGAENAIFVGDTIDADIIGAKSVGIRTIFIERRMQKDTENACPDKTIKNLSELLAALENC